MRPIHAVLPALMLAGIGGAIIAQPAAPAFSDDPSKAVAGTYSADPGHSQVLFTYKHMGLTWNMGLEAGGVLVGKEIKITLDLEVIKVPETITA